MRFDNLNQWKNYVVEHWQALFQQAAELALADAYQRATAIIILPVIPTNVENTLALVSFLEKAGVAGSLVDILRDHTRVSPFQPLTITELVLRADNHDRVRQQSNLRKLLFQDNALAAASYETLFDIVIDFLGRVPEQRETTHGLTVVAEKITSENNVIIAGRDVYTYDSTEPHRLLTSYLSELRAQWNYLDFSSIVPDPSRHLQTRLHQLYTPLDVWNIAPLDLARAEELALLRQRAVEQDLLNSRLSTVESASNAAHLVITGGPGTGKSTVCGFLTTGLAYACDPDSEQQDGIRGLDLLGTAWKHGALLPVYVRLRHFASDRENFPEKLKDASQSNLIGYLKKRLPRFGSHLTTYFSRSPRHNGGNDIHGAILILDGLDEIYDLKDRRKAKSVIEHFADTFPHCRILVTCRSAAYRHNPSWRLSDRFKTAELAPYTWDQVSQYIRNWYSSTADNRPYVLGGQEVAHNNAKKSAINLIQTFKSNANLWSLARQPLLLALMVLIHEENRHLPRNRAELYEKTVNLLHRWNPPEEDDPLAVKLQALDYQRVGEVLQLTAFKAQRDRARYKDAEASIRRPELIEQLVKGDGPDHLLGADVGDVLEYLATRNGILVADSKDSYQFLHLSIREYLAACALIEQYDEITMPSDMKPVGETWEFPENIRALLSKDPYRWREVALFCGSILGNDRGQDRLWTYLETLLPDMKPYDKNAMGNRYDEGDIYRIVIAAAVWSDNQMRTRLRSHHGIQDQLREAIQAILKDDRLDVPEHTQLGYVLRRIITDTGDAAVLKSTR